MGREADALAFLSEVAAAPFRYDFYQVLRRLESFHDDRPRLGRAMRPVDDPIRLGQEPSLAFAPAPLASCDVPPGEPPRLQVHLFGLLGPNGPLPIHITEYARERLRLAGDPTLSRFLDVFQHRFLSFLYQAWAQAQPHVNRDRPDTDRFSMYVGAFLGVAPATLRDRDLLPDEGKFFHAGMLVRGVRNAEGLASILRHYFRVPVTIEEFVGQWLDLDGPQRTRLGREGTGLGSTAVLGARVWDRQSKFRVRLGPLGLESYRGFLPGGLPLARLVDWIRLYLGFELDWDVRLALRAAEVPRLQLGAGSRLGWTTWLGQRHAAADADDVCLDGEASLARFGVPTS